jgi:hypothetical protein
LRKTDIHDDIGLSGEAMTEPERDEADIEFIALTVAEMPLEDMTQVMDGELAGINRQVSLIHKGLQQFMLDADAVTHRAVLGEWMAAAGFGETFLQDGIVTGDEEQKRAHIFGGFEDRFGGKAARARVDADGERVLIDAFFCKRCCQREREIIEHLEAEIFEGF